MNKLTIKLQNKHRKMLYWFPKFKQIWFFWKKMKWYKQFNIKVPFYISLLIKQEILDTYLYIKKNNILATPQFLTKKMNPKWEPLSTTSIQVDNDVTFETSFLWCHFCDVMLWFTMIRQKKYITLLKNLFTQKSLIYLIPVYRIVFLIKKYSL